jgi:hypothetical protein
VWWQAGPDDGGDVVGGSPAGYRVTHLDKAVCQAQRAATVAHLEEQDRAATAASKTAQDAEDEALKQQAELMARLLGEVPGCVASGYDWAYTVTSGAWEVVSQVHLRQKWSRGKAIDGSTCYLQEFGNARILHATRAVVEQAWRDYPVRALYSDTAWIDEEYSQVGLEKWLSAYGPESQTVAANRADPGRPFSALVAGWECRAFKAGRLDLLRAEGVLPAT